MYSHKLIHILNNFFTSECKIWHKFNYSLGKLSKRFIHLKKHNKTGVTKLSHTKYVSSFDKMLLIILLYYYCDTNLFKHKLVSNMT